MYMIFGFLKYHISVHSRRTSTWSYIASVMDTGWTITKGRERRKAVKRTSDRIKPESWSDSKPNSTTNKGMPRRSRWRRRECTRCYKNRHLWKEIGLPSPKFGEYSKTNECWMCCVTELRCMNRGIANRRMMKKHQRGQCQLTCWTERANHVPKFSPTWLNRRGKRRL